MKIQKRFISIMGVLLMVLIFSVSTAKAEEKEQHLIDNTEVQSLQFGITYEHNDVNIALIAPSGRIITPEGEGDDVLVYGNDYGVYIVVKDAEAGEWFLRYDKGSNESIDVSVDPYEEAMWITQFDILSIEDDVLEYEFMVEHEEDIYLSYTLSLAMDDMLGDSKVLLYGNAYTNVSNLETVDLSDINSYDNYYLCLRVTYYKNDLEYFDIAYAGPFTYDNLYQIGTISDYNVSVHPDAGAAYVQWGEYIDYDIDEVYVTATSNGDEIYAESYRTDEADSCMISYGDDVSSMEIGISVKNRYGRVSEPVYKTIELGNSGSTFYIDLSEQGLINTYQWGFAYKNARNQEIKVLINEDEMFLNLDGDGEQIITLVEVMNDVTISYNDNGVEYIYALMINVDSIPPMLTILENLDGSKTDNESVIITGRTEALATLLINDIVVVVDQDGMFIHTLSLEIGDNLIRITAADELGNTSIYNAIVYREGDAIAAMGSSLWQKNSFLSFFQKHMILLGIIGLVVLILIAVLTMVLGKRKENELRKGVILKKINVLSLIYTIVFGAVGMAGTIYYFYRRTIKESERYIRMAGESVEDAYEYLLMTDEFKMIVLISWGLMIFCLLVFLITRWIRKRYAKKSAISVLRQPQVNTAVSQGEIPVVPDTPIRQDVISKVQVELEVPNTPITQVEPEISSTPITQVKLEVPNTPITQVEPEVPNTPITQVEPEISSTPTAQVHKSQQTLKFCSYCGSKLALKDQFCKFCGKKQL